MRPSLTVYEDPKYNQSASERKEKAVGLYIDAGKSREFSIEKCFAEQIKEYQDSDGNFDQLNEIVLFLDNLHSDCLPMLDVFRQLILSNSKIGIAVTVTNELLFDTLLADGNWQDAKFYELSCWGPSRIRELSKHFFQGGNIDPIAAFDFVSNSLRQTDLPATPVVVILYLLVFDSLNGELSSLSFLHLLQEIERIRLGNGDNSAANALYNKRRILARFAAEMIRVTIQLQAMAL